MSARIASVFAVCTLATALTSCFGGGMDLFGGDSVDKSISTSTINGPKSNEALSDEMTVRNAVTSADVAKLSGSPIPWANASTGSAGVINSIQEEAKSGHVCRLFNTTRHSYQGIANFEGTACLTGNGNWQLLSFQEAG